MSTDLHSPPEQNLSELVTGIMKDAEDLFRQQIKLVRTEVKEDLRKSKEAAIPLTLGIWIALVGSILLSVTLALGLVALNVPEWAAFGIVGGALFLAGGGLMLVGKMKFDSFNPLPDKSAEALMENLEWKTKPK